MNECEFDFLNHPSRWIFETPIDTITSPFTYLGGVATGRMGSLARAGGLSDDFVIGGARTAAATELRVVEKETLDKMLQWQDNIPQEIHDAYLGVSRGLAPSSGTGIVDDVVRAADRDFAPGSLSAAKSWTRSGRLRAYQRDYNLPIRKGYARYIPPESWSPNQALPRGRSGGFIDKFGNEWVQGVSRTPGQLWEWDVQLGRNASKYFRDKARGGTHVNVSWDGEITH